MARDSTVTIHPDEVLKAYTLGYFPMARTHDDVHPVWVLPDMRGVLPLEQAELPKKLQRFVAKDPFQISINQNFHGVISACAMRGAGPSEKVRTERSETWINDAILEVYCELHYRGFAHSVECWVENELVGGLYGIALGGVFFGESMFSRQTNASKVAMVHLLGRLKMAGYHLLDTQFYTDHLAQFGVVEIRNEAYQEKLAKALEISPHDPLCKIHKASSPVLSDGSLSCWVLADTRSVLQSITQTS